MAVSATNFNLQLNFLALKYLFQLRNSMRCSCQLPVMWTLWSCILQSLLKIQLKPTNFSLQLYFHQKLWSLKLDY